MTFRAKAFSTAILGAAMLAGLAPAQADKIKHPTAIFAGLDKITGRIITFDVAIDETVQFGTLQITPRVCYTRPPTEAAQTTGFVEVDDIGLNGEAKRIFSGWMFAASPGLHGVEHPVYDVWLTDCRGGKDIIHTPPETADLRDEQPPPQAQPTPAQGRQRQPARQATPAPAPSPQQPAAAAGAPALGQAIEVGPAPGARQPTQPGLQGMEGGGPPAPAPARQPRQPAPREPFLLPPANIPSAR